jgi:actinorhodin biosynthesis protein ActVIA
MPNTTELAVSDAPLGKIYNDVQQFYAHQALLLDRGLLDEEFLRRWAETFTEDGSFWINFTPRPATGRERIFQLIRTNTQHVRAQNLVRRHWFNMLAVDPRADGSVHTQYYALVLATSEGGLPQIDASTMTRDVLVCQDGALRTLSRQVRRDDIP